MTFSIAVELPQAGTGGHRSGYQHESWRALGQRALRCDWPPQMAVWCMVTWCHAGQSYGVRRPSRVSGSIFLYLMYVLLFHSPLYTLMYHIEVEVAWGSYNLPSRWTESYQLRHLDILQVNTYVSLAFSLTDRRVHITEATLKHLNKAYEVEEGNGHLRDPYLKELDVQTYLVIDPRVSSLTIVLAHFGKKSDKYGVCKTRARKNNCWYYDEEERKVLILIL